jgi:hypothetical protein
VTPRIVVSTLIVLVCGCQPRASGPATAPKGAALRRAAAPADPRIVRHGLVTARLYADGRVEVWSDERPSRRGDLDCDGTVDFRDINPFVAYLSNLTAWLAAHPGCNPRNGDIDCDGMYPDLKDVQPFVALLTNRPPVARAALGPPPPRWPDGDGNGDGTAWTVWDARQGTRLLDVPIPVGCDASAVEAMNVRYRAWFILDMGDVAVWQREVRP